ncbi:MAG: hypothetical protein ABIH38_00805 [Patescibacteria group bacterium]
MTKEKWEEIKGQIKDSFSVTDERKEPLGEDRPGEMEIIEFNGPLGKMKLEFITHPVVLDKKGMGSKRIGGHVAVEYIYSKDEFVHTFIAYKWDDPRNDWVEMEAGEKGSFSM